MEVEEFRRLLAPEGQRLLERATGAYDEKDPIRSATTLRKDHPAELVAAALTQVALRRQAAEKFGSDAARMYFTRDGLEQATPRAVADHRARRFAREPVSRRPVTDLCCGIGGDLFAFARAGLDATGVDRDPLTVEIARANLAALGLSAAVVQADVETYRIGDPGDPGTSGEPGDPEDPGDPGDPEEPGSPAGAIFADPARRTGRGRVFDPQAYAPPWDFVLRLLERTAAVKTAPAIPHDLIPGHVEAEWVSLHGEVKEAALWSGELRTQANRRATVLSSFPSPSSGPVVAHTLTDRDDPGEAPVAMPVPGSYLYEPDGAVIRAGLVTAVAPLIDGSLVHPRIAYLTSDRLIGTPYARAYAVQAVLPYDPKALKRHLANTGSLTIKKRGVDVDPEKLRKRLLGKGSGHATVIVTRTPERTVCLIADLVDPASSGVAGPGA